jgi:hypothetical protein
MFAVHVIIIPSIVNEMQVTDVNSSDHLYFLPRLLYPFRILQSFCAFLQSRTFLVVCLFSSHLVISQDLKTHQFSDVFLAGMQGICIVIGLLGTLASESRVQLLFDDLHVQL